MQHVTLLILLALLQFWVLVHWTLPRVRRASGGADTTARPTAMVEQLVLVLPAAWLFGVFVDDAWAAGLGLVFMVARAVAAPRRSGDDVGGGGLRRTAAATIAAVQLVLIVGALVGLVLHWSMLS